MIPGVLAARRAAAMRRMKAATTIFAAHLEVDPPAFEAISRRSEPEVVRVKEIELLAEWQWRVIESLGWMPEEPPESEEQDGEPPAQGDESQDAQATAGPAAPATDDGEPPAREEPEPEEAPDDRDPEPGPPGAEPPTRRRNAAPVGEVQEVL